MATPKSGSLINVYLRPFGSTAAYKSIVCGEDLTIDATADAIERPTKCGTLKVAGTPSYEISGTGTWDSAASGTTLSALELFDYFAAGTLLDVVVGDASSGATLLDFSGSGYVTACPINAPAEDMVNFDFTISISGALANNI